MVYRAKAERKKRRVGLDVGSLTRTVCSLVRVGKAFARLMSSRETELKR